MSREVLAVFGKTGFGKSVWTRKYAQGKNRIFVFDPLRDFPCEYLTSEQLIERFDNGEFDLGKNFIVGSGDLLDLELLGALTMLASECLLIIEECAICFQKHEKLPLWLRDIVFLGRHRSASVLVTAQRAASAPIDLRSQVSRLVTFRQSENDDLIWLKPFLNKDEIQQLPTLPVLTCIDAGNDGKTTYSIKP